MTNIKSLQDEIDDLLFQAHQATADAERLTALAINYDANGVPNKAELDRGLAAQRMLEAKSYKSTAETKQKEQQKMIDQVDQIDRQITDL